MKGGLGDERYGFSSTDRTVNGRSLSPSARARTRTSSSATDLAATMPLESKSFPVATLVPPTATSVAVNAGAVAESSSMSQ
jgi:hypothetical protein